MCRLMHSRQLTKLRLRRLVPGGRSLPLPTQAQPIAINIQKRARTRCLLPPADGPGVIEPAIGPSLGVVSITRTPSTRLGPGVAPLAVQVRACKYLGRAGHGQERRIRADRQRFAFSTAAETRLVVVTLAVAGRSDRTGWHCRDTVWQDWRSPRWRGGTSRASRGRRDSYPHPRPRTGGRHRRYGRCRCRVRQSGLGTGAAPREQSPVTGRHQFKPSGTTTGLAMANCLARHGAAGELPRRGSG